MTEAALRSSRPDDGATGEIEFPQNGRFRSGSSSPPFSSPDSVNFVLPSSFFVVLLFLPWGFSSLPPLIFLQIGSFDLGDGDHASVLFTPHHVVYLSNAGTLIVAHQRTDKFEVESTCSLK